MKIEATITAPLTLDALVQHTRELHELSYDTILVPEAGHDSSIRCSAPSNAPGAASRMSG